MKEKMGERERVVQRGREGIARGERGKEWWREDERESEGGREGEGGKMREE